MKRVALVAAFVLAAVAPASSDAAGFCPPEQIHDYAKPVRFLPKLHQLRLFDEPGFFPKGVFLRTGGSLWRNGNPRLALQLGAGPVGFQISYERPESSPPPIDWLVVAKLVELRRRGQVEVPLGFHKHQIVRPQRGRDDLTFSVPDRTALYRTDLVIRNSAGRVLGRYGEFVRVLKTEPRASIWVDPRPYRPGERVQPYLANPGTTSLSFGLSSYYERFDGTDWVSAPGLNGPALAIGLGIPPGTRAPCWARTIPAGTPPGDYRVSVLVESNPEPLPGPRYEGQTLLSAAFSVVP
jgi:hypothetical protein